MISIAHPPTNVFRRFCVGNFMGMKVVRNVFAFVYKYSLDYSLLGYLKLKLLMIDGKVLHCSGKLHFLRNLHLEFFEAVGVCEPPSLPSPTPSLSYPQGNS